jgi:Leucine-rich repeat (LRR) protein
VIRERLSLGAEKNLTCDVVSGLTELDANCFEITSVVGIQNLTSLDSLYLGDNSISDIDPLSRLTSLGWLHLVNNSIADIGVLSGLTNLTNLSLDNNPNLTDIQPLLDNTGLGAGDTVNLESTGVSCTHVAALEAKGVEVQSDCP